MNFRRKSTIGWSVGNILLDLTGGVLNFCQMGVQSIDQRKLHLSFDFTSWFVYCIALLLFSSLNKLCCRYISKFLWKHWENPSFIGEHSFQCQQYIVNFLRHIVICAEITHAACRKLKYSLWLCRRRFSLMSYSLSNTMCCTLSKRTSMVRQSFLKG